MSVDITHYFSYSTPIPRENAQDPDRLALALALLTSSDLVARRRDDFPYGLHSIMDLNEVFSMEFAFDQMMGGPYFPMLSGGYLHMNRNRTDHRPTAPVVEFFTDERKALIDSFADIFSAPEPEWMTFAMIS